MQQGASDGAGSASRSQKQSRASATSKTGNCGGKILHEAEAIGVRAHENAVFEIKGINRRELAGKRIGKHYECCSPLLVRHGHIATKKATRCKVGQECLKLVGRNGPFDVFPRNSIVLQPMIMDERRAGMADGPADNTAAQLTQ